eukprot:7793628-Alexandrium_andersonii.AAC.1
MGQLLALSWRLGMISLSASCAKMATDASRLQMMIVINIAQRHDAPSHGCQYHGKLLGHWCMLA